MDGFDFTGHQLPRADRGAVRPITYAGHTFRFVAARPVRRGADPLASAASDDTSCVVAGVIKASPTFPYTEQIVIAQNAGGLTGIEDPFAQNGSVGYAPDAQMGLTSNGLPTAYIVVAIKADPSQTTYWNFTADSVGQQKLCI